MQSIAICLAILPGSSSAQDALQANWSDLAATRLKAIYEEGEFRAEPFQGEWLADSRGYVIRQRDPETNQPRKVVHDARTGKRLEEREIDPNQPQRFLSPDGRRKLEFRDGNLFVRDLKSGRRVQLTRRPADRDITYRNPIWSPDGKQIVFTESDVTDVRFRPTLAPVDPTYPRVEKRRFARVGEKIAKLRVGVVAVDQKVDVDGKRVQWLDIETPSEGFYLGQVDWAGNSEEVLIEKLSRFRDTREFFLVNPSGGSERIYVETNSAWAVGSQGINSGLDWIDNGEAFIVLSEKDGWRHAFLYSRDGTQKALLTPGEYDIIDRAVVDEHGGWFYFYASPDDGTQKYLYRVPLDGTGTLHCVTPEDQPGTHHYDFSPNSQWAFHTFSTMDRPPVTELVELPDHRTVRVLEDNRELNEKMAGQIIHPTEFFEIKTKDGISMDTWMIKPSDFDAEKKYPVFVYVYGEPYAQTVLDQWGTHHADFHRLIADKGYLVVSIDNRGTPAPKGAAWRRSIFGSLGPLSTEDQAAALAELGRTRPYVDLDRVGIWGWSGGGSNTLNAMFRKPESYHVGIAVVPKPQPHLYNAWFQEIYMRTQEVNREGYQRSAPIHFAEGLRGKLLMITGSGETNTHIQIVEGLVDRLIELGKPFDYMVYPNRDHGLREGKGTSVHLRMLIARYLVENLPPGPR